MTVRAMEIGAKGLTRQRNPTFLGQKEVKDAHKRRDSHNTKQTEIISHILHSEFIKQTCTQPSLVIREVTRRDHAGVSLKS